MKQVPPRGMPPLNRISCPPQPRTKPCPADKNNIDLKKACKTICINESFQNPKQTIIIINPSWLSVDIATTFLRSVSKQADTPANTIVTMQINLITLIFKNIILKRINTYTPAVTRVEEWTKEDTGVGAAIAAGNQAENGSWALFVAAPRNKKKN